MSGYLGVQRTIVNHLNNISLTNSGSLRVQNNVVVVVVVICLWMLAGQMFPQRCLPGELGVAPGARYLNTCRGRGMFAISQSRFVPASMRCQVGRTGEPLVAFGASILDMSYPRASVLGQLERVLVQLPAEFALIWAEPVLDLGQLRSRLLGDFNDVEGWINVSRDHRLVRAQDHSARYRAAGVLVKFQPSGVLLLWPLEKFFTRS